MNAIAIKPVSRTEQNNFSALNEQSENKPKKITFNIDRIKYIKLSCYALKYDMTLTDLYNEMTDDFLEKHFEEISSIKGVF